LSVEEVIAELKSKVDPKGVKGMERFGISSKNTLGISIPVLRKTARKVGVNHDLALGLWKSGIHEARILAAMVDDPARVTERQMESWANDFDSWDVVDGTCGSLFDMTPMAYAKALEWAEREEEFVKRAGYVLMAELSVHDKNAGDAEFIKFFEAIERGSTDARNFVKKAVNWALRQIGKRNLRLNKQALRLAEKIAKKDSGSAKWVASDAIRELRSEGVQRRLRHSS
jgi:3-methyladenine DNA glycosylase AlkD